MPRPKNASLALFVLVAAVALAFAAYTNHVWEDYYITWRSSKNLATGHGLVFNHGDRLHTFTSPLGVLLPAVASLLTFNCSDAAALWIFRLMSCAALGGAALLFASLARRQAYGKIATAFIIALLALDSKTIDFAINGMETAFLMLFLAYALWAHLTPGPRQWLHLGGAWAALMWTRPDSFIYIGLIAAGFWLFNEPARTGRRRGEMIALFFRAGLVTVALYAPWLLFTWAYYGTPVPHTITAKSGIGDPRTVAGLLHTLVYEPFNAWKPGSSMEGTFLPAYYVIGYWPNYIIQIARALAVGCSLVWLLPFLRVETRTASFAFFGAHVYLAYYPYFPFPWYLPSTTLLALFTLGSLVAQGATAATGWQAAHPNSARPGQWRGFAAVLLFLTVAGSGWLTWQSARTFAAQQKYIEDGGRRKIGEWLRTHARPGDAVFMEPLGYIGYFSGLKTYDFPGMSSREMVEARKTTAGLSWARLIATLKPQWVVLRPHEVQRVRDDDAELLDGRYALAAEFSVADEIAALDVYGRAYLEHDARFAVYERTSDAVLLKVDKDSSPFDITRMTVDNVEVTFAHAPSVLHRMVPRYAKHGTVRFGLIASAYTDADLRTDGAVFTVELVSGGQITTVVTRALNPVANGADRGMQTFSFDLPPHDDQAVLRLRAGNGGGTAKDWTYWSAVEFN